MDRAIAVRFREEAEKDLLQNILPFWERHVADKVRGGFHGLLGNDLRIDENAPRGVVLNARLLWTYAMAYRRYGSPQYKAMAEHAYAYMQRAFWDKEYGGLFWTVDREGKPLQDRKQIYGQAFAIYALSEYHLATGEETSLEMANKLFELIEAKSHDNSQLGYFEAYTREWTMEGDLRLSNLDMNEKKSNNTHLHVLEAYTNFARISRDPRIIARLKELIELFLEHIIDPRTGHLFLFFDENWAVKSDVISYGHDIEGSWLLCEAAEVVGDAGLQRRVEETAVKMARVTLAEGFDKDGGMFYEGDPKGITNPDKEWWPQAESAIGFLNAYQLAGDESFFATAWRSWQYVEAHLIDREHGEWFGRVRNGSVDLKYPKVSLWKCPYHNARACNEIIKRLDQLALQ